MRNSTGFNVSIANELEPVRYSGILERRARDREWDDV